MSLQKNGIINLRECYLSVTSTDKTPYVNPTRKIVKATYIISLVMFLNNGNTHRYSCNQLYVLICPITVLKEVPMPKGNVVK